MKKHYSGLKRKLITCFMLIIFVMSVICLIVFISNIIVSTRFNSIYENTTLIVEISNAVEQLEESTERYLSTKSTDFLEAAHESMNSLGLLTYELKGWQPTSKEKMMIALFEVFKEYRNKGLVYGRRLRKGNRKAHAA